MKKHVVFLTLLCVLLAFQGVFAAQQVLPTAAEELKYTGEAQPLIADAGGLATEGYEFYFCVESEDETCETFDASTWVPTADVATGITGTEAATYAVHYQSHNPETEVTGKVNGTIEVVIAPKTVDITWTGPFEFEYDGEAKLPEASVDGETVEVTVATEDGTDAVDAGTYNAVATIEDTNYAVNEETAKQEFTITPKTVDITWAGPFEFEYVGEPVLPAASVDGETVEVTVATEDGTDAVDAGTYNAVATIADPNYAVNEETANQEFTITPKAITFEAEVSELVYTGEEQTPELTASGLVGEDTCNWEGTFTPEGSIIAGDYTIEITSIDNPNYVLSEEQEPITYTINPKALDNSDIEEPVVEVVIEPASFIFDGFEKTPSYRLTYNGADLVEGTDYEVDAENSQLSGTNVGEYTIIFKAIEAAPADEGSENNGEGQDQGGIEDETQPAEGETEPTEGEEQPAEASSSNFTGETSGIWTITEAQPEFQMFRIGEGPRQGSFCNNCNLPPTGFSSRIAMPLSVKPAGLNYADLNMHIQIPALNVEAELAGVPLVEETWAVEWLGSKAGLLSGSYAPGEGLSVIAAHNTLNNTEYGPFAMLATLENNDVIFITKGDKEMTTYRVFANELLRPNDMQKLASIAEQVENALVLVTCENEAVEGGYQNRRVVFAKPM